jgi:hypothetical protein
MAELLPQHAAAQRLKPVRPVHQRSHRRACQSARQPEGTHQASKTNPASPAGWLKTT